MIWSIRLNVHQCNQRELNGALQVRKTTQRMAQKLQISIQTEKELGQLPEPSKGSVRQLEGFNSKRLKPTENTSSPTHSLKTPKSGHHARSLRRMASPPDTFTNSQQMNPMHRVELDDINSANFSDVSSNLRVSFLKLHC